MMKLFVLVAIVVMSLVTRQHVTASIKQEKLKKRALDSIHDPSRYYGFRKASPEIREMIKKAKHYTMAELEALD